MGLYVTLCDKDFAVHPTGRSHRLSKLRLPARTSTTEEYLTKVGWLQKYFTSLF